MILAGYEADLNFKDFNSLTNNTSRLEDDLKVK